MSRTEWVRDTLIAAGYSPEHADRVMAEVKAEQAAEVQNNELADALRLIHEDMVTARNSGDEWASEWLNDLWTRLPLKLRAIVGDDEALSELAANGGPR